MAHSLFFIGDRLAFTPQISKLVGMMNDARSTTLDMVRGLSVADLDYLVTPDGNSLGMLLEHMAAVEVGYQAFTFEGNDDWDRVLGERWAAGGQLGALGRASIRGHPLRYYLENLRTVRAKTLEEFAKRDDAWLEEEIPFWGVKGNRHFAWFHVFEDEINHRGQMCLIRKALPSQQNRGVLGLGLEAAHEDDTGLRIDFVGADSPAQSAGLQVGDEILAIDGETVQHTPYDEISVTGPAHSSVKFTVRRGEQQLEISVTRTPRDQA
jgi:uncharacterized damage-inducible protein DinB